MEAEADVEEAEESHPQQVLQDTQLDAVAAETGPGAETETVEGGAGRPGTSTEGAGRRQLDLSSWLL